MKFGKLSDISQVDFKLPPDASDNQSLLSGYNFVSQPLLFTGCTGWSMKDWVGKIYPQNAKAKDFLKYYTRQFNTIELNTTHYRIPGPDLIKKWQLNSNSDFKFCPKIPQSISHSRELGLKDDKLIIFTEVIQQLEEKLGCCFMQLPPYFDFPRLGLLEAFLLKFPAHIPLAIEVRHMSWFDSKATINALSALLKQYNRIFLITDVAGRRDVLHQKLTTNKAMIRFVGNGLHPTDYQRIEQWLKRLKKWYEYGLEETYFFIHQPENVLAPDMVTYFVERAKSVLPGVITRGPKMNTAEGHQMSLF